MILNCLFFLIYNRVIDGGRDQLCSNKPRDAWSHPKLDYAKNRFPIEILEEALPVCKLNLGLLASRTVEDFFFLLFKPIK